MVAWKPNSLQMMIDVFNRNYGGIDADVCFTSNPDPSDQWVGRTIFPDDGGVPQVHINIECTVEGAMEVLAHELAHLAVPSDEDHGPEWQATFDRIYDLWSQEMCEHYELR